MALASLSRRGGGGIVYPSIEFFISGMQTSSRYCAPFSPYLSFSGLYIHCSSLFSPSSSLHPLLPSFPSPKPESDSFPLALFTPAALTSLGFHVSVSIRFSNVAHLSLVNVAVTRKGRS